MIYFVFSLLGLGILALAYKASPASEKRDEQIDPLRPRASTNKLIVASYNIQTGKDINGKRDIRRAADVIKGADVVGIQEVQAPTWLSRLGITSSQLETLAGDRFGSLMGATRRRWFREHRGNALLSRLPLTNISVSMLPDKTGKSFRNMMIARLQTTSGEVVLINTHLHTSKGRRQQLEVVKNEFRKHSRVILFGDFNSTRDDPTIIEVLKDPTVTDVIGDYCDSEEGRIDWIFSRGISVQGCTSVPKGVSDHPYYEAVFSV